VFDINDFDETLPGPWEWDVKRLAASMLIGARDNGVGTNDQDRIVLDTVGQYRAGPPGAREPSRRASQEAVEARSRDQAVPILLPYATSP
jgi:uncharacterized protein (DUF2252 family)